MAPRHIALVCRYPIIGAILLELLFWSPATGRPTNLRSGYADIE
jgi:hypothetical protein